jgi:hypothetical protein
VRAEEVGIGLSTDVLDDQAEQIITCVAVNPFVSGLKIQGALGHKAKQFIRGVILANRSEKIGQIRIALNPGSMSEQMTDGHVAPG